MNALHEEIRVVAHGLWCRRWLGLGVAWAVCVAGWLVVSLIPNRYASSARVHVQLQSILSDKVGITQNDSQRSLDRVRQTLTSAENMHRVVKATILASRSATDADLRDYAATLARDVRVVATTDNMFDISVETGFRELSDAANARLAQDVATRLVDIFVEANLADDRAEARRSVAFLDQEITGREKALREAEARKVIFEQRHLAGISGTGSIDQRIAAIQADLISLEPSLAAAQGSLAAANAQMVGTPAVIAGGAVASPGASRLAQLEAQLADAQARGWTEAHPDVRAIRAQMARVQVSGGATVAGGATNNPAYLGMRAMQAERQAAAAALATRKAQLRSDLDRLRTIQLSQPALASEHGRLIRDLEVLRAQYDKLIADREDVRLRGMVASRADAVRFRVVQPPGFSAIPASPNRPLLLFGVLFVGIGAGVGAAFVAGQLQTSFATADRLAKATGLTVLGSIPRTFSVGELEQRKERLKWFAGGAGGLVASFVLLLAVEFIQRGLVA